MNERIIELQDAINTLVAIFSDRGQQRIRQEGIKAAKPVYETLAWVQDSIIPDLSNRLDALVQEAEDAESDRELLANFPQKLRDELYHAAEDFPVDYSAEPEAEEYTKQLFSYFYQQPTSHIAGLVDRWLYLLTGSSENEMPKSCEAVIRQVISDCAQDVFERRMEVDSD